MGIASFTKRDGEMISFLQRAFLRFYFMPFQTFFPVFLDDEIFFAKLYLFPETCGL